jgi:hypothetical protein
MGGNAQFDAMAAPPRIARFGGYRISANSGLGQRED